MATCKECKMFDIEAAKDKAGRVLSNRPALCNWVSKEKYPLSVPKVFGRRPKAGWTTAKDGNGCPCFQKRRTK